MATNPNTPARPPIDDESDDWCIVHQHQIAAYNVWAEQRPTFSASVQAWRDSTESKIPT